MNTLVDTSVWSLAFRRSEPVVHRAKDLLADLMIGGHVVLLGIVLQEVLCGIRHRAQFEQLREDMASVPLLAMQRGDHEEAALLWTHCRSKGIRLGTPDALIAAVAIRRNWPVLTIDQDFQQVAQVSNLRLVPIETGFGLV